MSESLNKRINTMNTTSTRVQSIVQLLLAYMNNFSYEAVLLPNDADPTKEYYTVPEPYSTYPAEIATIEDVCEWNKTYEKEYDPANHILPDLGGLPISLTEIYTKGGNETAPEQPTTGLPTQLLYKVDETNGELNSVLALRDADNNWTFGTQTVVDFDQSHTIYIVATGRTPVKIEYTVNRVSEEVTSDVTSFKVAIYNGDYDIVAECVKEAEYTPPEPVTPPPNPSELDWDYANQFLAKTFKGQRPILKVLLTNYPAENENTECLVTDAYGVLQRKQLEQLDDGSEAFVFEPTGVNNCIQVAGHAPVAVSMVDTIEDEDGSARWLGNFKCFDTSLQFIDDTTSTGQQTITITLPAQEGYEVYDPENLPVPEEPVLIAPAEYVEHYTILLNEGDDNVYRNKEIPYEKNKTYFMKDEDGNSYSMYMKFDNSPGLTFIGSTTFTMSNLVTSSDAAQTYARVIRSATLPRIDASSVADKNCLYVVEDNTFSTPEYDTYIIVENEYGVKEYQLICSTKTYIDLTGYCQKDDVYDRDEIDAQMQSLFNYLHGALDYVDDLDEYDDLVARLADQLNGEII